MTELSDEVTRKYIETKYTDEWEVETDQGWVSINNASKTVEYEIWIVETSLNKVLKCADNHILFRDEFEQVFVKDLKIGDSIITKDGLEVVKSVENTGKKDFMYDLDIAGDFKRFYTDGILSHNSTVCGLYCLWYAMFSIEPVYIYILANKGKNAQGLLNDIKIAYEELEPYLKRGVVEYNKTSIEFDNRSVIQTGTTTKDAIRSETVSFLLLDEFAHVPPHIAEEFYEASLPSISTGGKICIISTPKGNTNLFYRLYKGAQDKANDYAPFSIDWREVPRYNEHGELIDPEVYKEQMINASSLQSWNQEYEAKFLGSSKTLIHGDKLEEIGKIIKGNEPNFKFPHWVCWEKPKEKHIYVIGVDTAKGVEQDKSVMQVIDITNPKLSKQVAVYSNNQIDPFDFTEKINELGKMYNNAYIIVENNTYGHEVCRRLWNDFEYENLYKDYKKKAFGVTASSKTKALATSLLKRQLENDELLLNDENTFNELCGFIEVTPDVYRCENGKNSHDDLVMALVWVSYFIGSEFWREWEGYIRKEISGHEESINNTEKELFEPMIFEKIFDNDRENIFPDSDLSW